MAVQKDFEELLALLNKNRIKYIIVGGYALAFHGAPRYTGDIDIYVKPDRTNAKGIMASLEEFGFADMNLDTSDFEKEGTIIQLGLPPVRVDIITSLTGISWEQSYSKRVKGKYGKTAVNYIGKNQLIKNKRALGRKKDLADIEALDAD